ncbi:MAG TPA: TetR/AcrR family transcriptional regulator [Acidimicrobiales bacterium]
MPVSTPTSRLRPRNRVAILDAARRLVDDKGEAFTTQDLVKEAGVALQTFYRHFEGKDQLLLAVIGDLTAQHCEALEARAASLGRPDERLRFYIVETLDSLVAAPGSSASRFMTSQHWRLYQSHPDEVVAANQPFADLVRRELEAGQAAGVFAPRDPETDAWLITKLVMAVFHHYSFLPEEDASRSIVDATLEFCLAAVRP